MFYDLDLLCRKRRGKFAVVWLAATRGIKNVPRAAVANLDITKVCTEILAVVNSESTVPAQRFSLYLSSQLIYGTVVCYQKQVVIFQEQLLFFMTQIRRPLGLSVLNETSNSDDGGVPSRKRRRTGGRSRPSLPQLPSTEQLDGQLAQLQLENQNTAHEMVGTMRESLLPQTSGMPREIDPFGDEGQLELQLAALSDAPWTMEAAVPTATSMMEEVAVHAEMAAPAAKRPRRNAPIEVKATVVSHGTTSPTTPPAQRLLRDQQAAMAEPLPEISAIAGPPAELAAEIAVVPPGVPEVAQEQARTRRRRTSVGRRLNYSVELRERRAAIDRGSVTSLDLLDNPRISRFVHESPHQLDEDRRRVNEELVKTLLAGWPEASAQLGAADLADTRNATRTGLAGKRTSAAQQEPLLEQELPPAEPTVEPSIAPQSTSVADATDVGQAAKWPQLSRIEREGPLEVPELAPSSQEHPVPPRIHTSTPIFATEAHRARNTLSLVRGAFEDNDGQPLTIEELCVPLDRRSVATMFADLLNLHSKKFVKLQSKPHSTELDQILPGPRL